MLRRADFNVQSFINLGLQPVLDVGFAEGAHKFHLFVVKTEAFNVLEANTVGMVPLTFGLALDVLPEVVLLAADAVPLDVSRLRWDNHGSVGRTLSRRSRPHNSGQLVANWEDSAEFFELLL